MDIDHGVFAGFITYLNARSVKVSGKFQATCAILTISSLVAIIVSGCIHMAQGRFSASNSLHRNKSLFSSESFHHDMGELTGKKITAKYTSCA